MMAHHPHHLDFIEQAFFFKLITHDDFLVKNFYGERFRVADPLDKENLREIAFADDLFGFEIAPEFRQYTKAFQVLKPLIYHRLVRRIKFFVGLFLNELYPEVIDPVNRSVLGQLHERVLYIHERDLLTRLVLLAENVVVVELEKISVIFFSR